MNSQLCLGSRRPLGDWTSRKKNTGNRRFRWTRSDLKTISFFTAGRQQVISVFHATGATGGGSSGDSNYSHQEKSNLDRQFQFVEQISGSMIARQQTPGEINDKHSYSDSIHRPPVKNFFQNSKSKTTRQRQVARTQIKMQTGYCRYVFQ